jgi:hypothetical protein
MKPFISSIGLYDVTISVSLICGFDFPSSCGSGCDAGVSVRRGRCDADLAVAATTTEGIGGGILVWREVTGGGGADADADADEDGGTVVQRGIVVGSEVVGRVVSEDDADGPVCGSKRVGRDRLRPVVVPSRWGDLGFTQADAVCRKKAQRSWRCSREKLVSSKRPDCKFESIVFCMSSVMVIARPEVVRAHLVGIRTRHCKVGLADLAYNSACPDPAENSETLRFRLETA